MFVKCLNGKCQIMKNRLCVVLVLLLAVSIVSFAAEKEIVKDPEKNFEHLWKLMDSNYSLFEAKNIDWNLLYKVYSPKVTAKTTDDELFGIMTSMLRHLNDNHVELLCKEPKRLSRSGYLGLLIDEMGTKAIELVSKRPVPAKAFISPPKLSENKIFLYGKLDEKIGYFHFGKVFDMESSTKAIDNILKEFTDMDAIIIDARLNIGGIDLITQAMVGRFADKKRLFMTTQHRNGSKHTDFTKKKEWYVEPQGAKQFTKKVILLTDRTTISSGENFALAMKVLPHVSVVGDFTSGCFADIRHLLLPNGWHIAIPINLFKDPTGFCWEGIGVPPDVWQHQGFDYVENGNDKVLKLAIEMIKASKR